MSNDNAGEKTAHLKIKVSSAMLITWGLVGPKSNPKGEIDGYAVNIPQLAFIA